MPYTASKYAAGFNSKVWYATNTAGTAGTYTALAQTMDIKGPDSEVGDIKITNNDSPTNSKEYAPGLTEPGTMSWNLVYRDDAYATLLSMFGNLSTYFWKEVFSDGSTWVGIGYIKKAPLVTKTEDEANTVEVEIKLVTTPTFTAGS